MKVISAVDYGTRTVVRVHMNDTEPETLRSDGSVQTKKMPTVIGDLVSPANLARIVGDPVKLVAYQARLAKYRADQSPAREWCPNCVDNRVIKEYQFEGAELAKEVEITPAIPADGDTPAVDAVFETQPKTDEEIITDALAQAAASALPIARLIPLE